MRGTEKRQILAFIIIMLIAFLVRSIGISSRPLWYDEAFAILFCEKGPSAMLYGTLTATSTGAADIHPLGYYTLLWVWMRVFGQSLVAVRILSVLAGVSTVFFAYLLTKNLFNSRTATIAALFVALAPFPIHYSQEIRMYSFLALWLLIATYAYLRGSQDKSWGWWALFSVSTALAQYTHNLAAFYLIPLAITPLLQRNRQSFISTSLAGLGALILYIPWLIQLPSQFTKVSSAYWVERPGFAKLFTLLLTYVTNLPLPDGWLFPALFITLAVISIGLLQTFRASNRNPSALWLLYLSFAPPIFLFLFSQWVPVYIERALLPSGVIFCIWLAWALFETSLPKILSTLFGGLLILGAVVGLYQHVTYRGFPYAPFQQLGTSLQERSLPGDKIIHSSKATRLPMAYYGPDLVQAYIAEPPGSKTDTLAVATQQVLGVLAQPDITFTAQDAERVWFIVFKWHIDAYTQLGYENHPYLSQLEDSFALETTENWGDLRVYLFVRPQENK